MLERRLACLGHRSTQCASHKTKGEALQGIRRVATKIGGRCWGKKTHRFRAIVRCCPWRDCGEIRVLREGESGGGIKVDEVMGDGAREISGDANGGGVMAVEGICLSLHVVRAVEGERSWGRRRGKEVRHVGGRCPRGSARRLGRAERGRRERAGGSGTRGRRRTASRA